MTILKVLWFIAKVIWHNMCVIITFGKSEKAWLSLKQAIIREMDWILINNEKQNNS